MAERGAPIGNTNSSKANRLWGDTLRRIAAQDPQKLRAIAETLYQKAADGDIQAAKEIGDRLDGKAPQSVELAGPDGGPVQIEKVERVIVDAQN